MDKDDERLYISYEALSQLNALKERFKYMTKADIVEMLIKDRFSVSDQHKNASRRRESRNKYLDEHDHCGRCESAFTAGYSAGWLHFQTRHGEDKLIIEIEPE